MNHDNDHDEIDHPIGVPNYEISDEDREVHLAGVVARLDTSVATPGRPSLLHRFLLWILSLFPHIVIRREGGAPYLTRYCLLGGDPFTTTHPIFPFNVFIHCFHQSDGEEPHNHPWKWSRSFILRGAQREHRLLNPTMVLFDGPKAAMWYRRTLRSGNSNLITGDTFHHVEILTPTVWTLFVCGRKTQRWGFLSEHGFETATTFLARQPGATSNQRVIDE